MMDKRDTLTNILTCNVGLIYFMSFVSETGTWWSACDRVRNLEAVT